MRRLLRSVVCAALLLTSCAWGQTTAPALPQGERAPVRIVIVGDSTVCDYPEAHTNRGWGQYVAEHFKPGAVKVINLAASGRSTKTFLSEGRWKKALDEKPAYVFIQFGHNDSHTKDKPEATDAATEYKDFLRRYVAESQAIGAVPILVTPMVRRTFNAAGKFEEPAGEKSLQAYATAMKEVGAEKKAAVIDLYAASKALAEELGKEKSDALAAKAGDITHFNEKGARLMAGLVLKGLAGADGKLAGLMKGQ